jgi:hypothetical protein
MRRTEGFAVFGVLGRPSRISSAIQFGHRLVEPVDSLVRVELADRLGSIREGLVLQLAVVELQLCLRLLSQTLVVFLHPFDFVEVLALANARSFFERVGQHVSWRSDDGAILVRALLLQIVELSLVFVSRLDILLHNLHWSENFVVYEPNLGRARVTRAIAHGFLERVAYSRVSKPKTSLECQTGKEDKLSISMVEL